MFMGSYQMKKWANRNIGTSYKLDTYPEFFMKNDTTREEAEQMAAFIQKKDYRGYNDFVEKKYPPPPGAGMHYGPTTHNNK